MKALIISPNNNDISQSAKIPLEFFTDKDVRKVSVKRNDKELFTKNINMEAISLASYHLTLKGLKILNGYLNFMIKQINC